MTKFLHEFNDYGESHGWLDNGYWEIMWGTPEIGHTVRVENYCGGFHDHEINDHDEIIESDWQTVEKMYYASQTDRDCGWIDREGVFYGCGYMDHAACLDAISGLDTLAAEQAGYVKIYHDATLAKYMPEYAKDEDLIYYIDPHIRLTEAQARTLTERGFKIHEY